MLLTRWKQSNNLKEDLMKKTTYFFITIMSLMLFSLTAYASEPNMSYDIEYFDNGDYLVTTLENESSTPDISLFATTTTTKSKISRYYNANNEIMWYVKVTGTFTYGNGTSKCTSSTVTAQSNVTAWKITSKSASKSGNTASATATAKQYFDGTVVNTIKRTVTLTCSSTGVFS